MKKLYALIICLMWSWYSSAQTAWVIPQPKVMETTSGRWYLPKTLTVNERYLDEPFQARLIQLFTHELKRNLVFIQGEADINFHPIEESALEAHQIDVTNQLDIHFSTPSSRLLALASLKQLFVGEAEDLFLPSVHLEDHADYAWRGLHLDVSRHFFPVEDIYWLLDQMADYKLNTFHWHLTDDQGWRIEIKKYPKLTEIGSKRDQTIVGHASETPETFDGTPHGGFYTQKQIRAVVQYAQQRGITVVPEIEMPGHARAALAAYPEFSCFGNQLPVAQKWGVFEQVYCSKPATMAFLKDVLAEVLELFPSKYIHIGGDEVPKTHWKNCAACQLVMQENQLASEEALQSHFLNEINAFLTQNNRKMIGWDEILDGGLPNGAAVMRWRGTDKVDEAAKANAWIVQSPNAQLYFDHYQSKRNDQPLAIGGFTTLEEVYAYHLMPEWIDSALVPKILGGQANVWTEYIPNRAQLEFMLFPRMLALSEILWSETRADFDSFKTKLLQHGLPRLDRQNIQYAKALFETQANISPTDSGVLVQLEKSTPEAVTTIDNTAGRTSAEHWEVAASETVLETNTQVQTTYNEALVDEFSLQLLEHPMLGKAWTINVEPSENYRGENDIVLTDGIKGRRPWHGAEWLGFRDSMVELSYQFENKMEINELHLGMLHSPSSWIYLPDSVVVMTSKNGKKWSAQTFLVQQENQQLPIQTKATNLRILFYNNPSIPENKPGGGQAAWLFLDEVFCTFKP